MPERRTEKRLEPVWIGQANPEVEIPEVVVYKEIDFRGDDFRTNCNVDYVGDWFNDHINSIVVVSGTWTFYQHAGYNRTHRGFEFTLKPGYYPNLEHQGISSYKCIDPTNS